MMVGIRRTPTCGELRGSDIGKEVVLCGWVATVRPRRRAFRGLCATGTAWPGGAVQPGAEGSARARAGAAGRFVISVRPAQSRRAPGRNAQRGSPPANRTARDGHGHPEQVETPPFELDTENVTTEVQLKYRYMDIRRPEMQRNTGLPPQAHADHAPLFRRAGFRDVETPMLARARQKSARPSVRAA